MGNLPSKPDNLSEILRKTEFSQKEILDFYKQFKKRHPSQTINKNDLKAIYREKCPRGDAEKFSEFVFRVYDTDKNEVIDFQEFTCGLSAVSKGTEEEKRRFSFRLIDEDDDGYISRKEMIFLLAAYFRLQPQVNKTALERAIEKTEQAFSTLDKNNDDLLSYDEFSKVDLTPLLKNLIYK